MYYTQQTVFHFYLHLFIVILYDLQRCCANMKLAFTKECLVTIYKNFRYQYIRVNLNRKMTVLAVTVVVAKSNPCLCCEFLLLFLCFVIVVILKLDRNSHVDDRVLRENPTASKVMAEGFIRLIKNFTKGYIIKDEDGDGIQFINRIKKYAEDERLDTEKTKILKKIVILFNYGDECKVTKDSLKKQETMSFVNLDDPFIVEYKSAYNGNHRQAELEVMRIKRKNGDNDKDWTLYYIFHLENRPLKVLYKNYKEIGFDKRDLNLHIQLYYESLKELIENDKFLSKILLLYPYDVEDYETKGRFCDDIQNFIEKKATEDMWLEGGSWNTPQEFLQSDFPFLSLLENK